MSETHFICNLIIVLEKHIRVVLKHLVTCLLRSLDFVLVLEYVFVLDCSKNTLFITYFTLLQPLSPHSG